MKSKVAIIAGLGLLTLAFFQNCGSIKQIESEVGQQSSISNDPLIPQATPTPSGTMAVATPTPALTPTPAPIVPVNFAQATWSAISMVNAPSGRRGAAAVWTGTRMLIWGGIYCPPNGQNCQLLNTGGSYDPTTDTWEALPVPANFPARHYHASAWTGSEMIVWGGITTASVGSNDGAAYNPATKTWRLISKNGAPSQRASAIAFWYASKFHVLGGNFQGLQVNGAAYDPATDTWSNIPNSNMGVGLDTVAIIGNDIAIIARGAQGVTPIALDLKTNVQSPFAPAYALPSYGRFQYYPVSGFAGQQYVMYSGRSGGVFDTKTAMWSALPVNPLYTANLKEMAGVFTGKELIVFGGHDEFTRNVETHIRRGFRLKAP